MKVLVKNPKKTNVETRYSFKKLKERMRKLEDRLKDLEGENEQLKQLNEDLKKYHVLEILKKIDKMEIIEVKDEPK